MNHGITNKQFGQFIKYCRQTNDYTQADLSKQISISIAHISRLETDTYSSTQPSLRTIKKVLEFFDCNLEDIKNFDPENLQDIFRVRSIGKRQSPHAAFQVHSGVVIRMKNRAILSAERKKKLQSPRLKR